MNFMLALSFAFVLTHASSHVFAQTIPSTQSPQKLNPVMLSEFDHLDPRQVVPEKPLKQALTYFAQNRNRFENQDFLILIDFTKHASKKRLYLINLKTGDVDQHLVSHGKGSDPAATGYAKVFSNKEHSNATSLGFYKTAETYMGKHGLSLRLDGLSPTNSMARPRGVVIHAADYVQESNQHAGRSQGCPALDPTVFHQVINNIKGGVMIYAWSELVEKN